jgi:hypothetical protein
MHEVCPATTTPTPNPPHKGEGSAPSWSGRGNIPGTARAPSGLEETGESIGRGVTAGVTTL